MINTRLLGHHIGLGTAGAARQWLLDPTVYVKTMAKQLSNKSMRLLTPFGDDSCANFDAMTLDAFKLWSDPALKVFLSIRKRNAEESHGELAAR